MSQFPTEAYESLIQAVTPVAQARFFQKLASNWGVVVSSAQEGEALLKAAAILAEEEAKEEQKQASAISPLVHLVDGLEKAAANNSGYPAQTQINELNSLAESILAYNPQVEDAIAKVAEWQITQANAQAG